MQMWLWMTKREGGGSDAANDELPLSCSSGLSLPPVKTKSLSFFFFFFLRAFSLCSTVCFSPPLSYLPISASVSVPDPPLLFLSPSLSRLLSVTSKYSMSHCRWKGIFRRGRILYWYSNNSPRGDNGRPLSLILDVKTLIPIFSTFCMHKINPRLAGKI